MFIALSARSICFLLFLNQKRTLSVKRQRPPMRKTKKRIGGKKYVKKRAGLTPGGFSRQKTGPEKPGSVQRSFPGSLLGPEGSVEAAANAFAVIAKLGRDLRALGKDRAVVHCVFKKPRAVLRSVDH